MIYGIGVDIVRISKFKKALDRWGEKFINRIFTHEEILYCQVKRCPEEYFAVRFAAKEAVFKAMGEGLSWGDIEVRRRRTGKP
ncbi:MAG: holo-ACP synthase, partial [Thermodesulfobacteriota bacterium]